MVVSQLNKFGAEARLSRFRALSKLSLASRSGDANTCHEFDCGASLRKVYELKDVPHDVIDIMMASIAPATFKQYKSALKEWFNFCQTNENTNFFNPSIHAVLKYLIKKLLK
uniref:Core-binding (CB) domain-containing protein n=1 Tax=Trichogramma kaykai TaxID=54128 RepID=A0ABD2WPE1_9HYME